jgi:hypothetical protein
MMHLLTKMMNGLHHNVGMLVTSKMARQNCSNSHDVITDREADESAVGTKFPVADVSKRSSICSSK